ncbi:MAG: hypoxanthine phosphoribosyltransferase [Chlamydiae bacterium]|nr:hypoxanthine phosphoribosyltransferase [Chlamydiota bacterium]
MTKKFIPMITEESILEKIDSLALELDQKYQGQEVTLVMVLKGSICFASDLLRRMQTPVILETVQCKSYGQNGSLRGDLSISGVDTLDIEGKHVLVVDDIFDSGFTLSRVLETLQNKNPKTLTSAVLLAKEITREHSALPDYILFTIENQFVVGYGLDYKEHYRGLRGIYTSNGGF